MGLLVFILEMAVGLSLLTGTFVPLVSGLLGTALQINLLLGNYSVPGEWFWTYPLLIVSHLALLMGRAGRVFGVDALLASQAARSTLGSSSGSCCTRCRRGEKAAINWSKLRMSLPRG